MRVQTLQDGTASFQVSVYEAAKTSPAVLFAVGAGGQPERHVTLLEALATSGYTVIAPHFERLVSTLVSEEDMMLRARRLSLALDAFVTPGAIAVGVGHSIGAAALLALAGGQIWLGPASCLNIKPDNRLARLALLAPPTGFFRAPAALNQVWIPILAWAGTKDDITPPAQTEWLADTLRDCQVVVDVRITVGAGHFSFMDLPPPHTTEPLSNKPAFLHELSNEICRFVADR
jgi:pimeloyl-ACP methyl ester carboxylesterase